MVSTIRAAAGLGFVAGLAALVGCGGSLSQAAPPVAGALGRAAADRHDTQPTVFVSDYAGVNLYAESNDPDKIGEIDGTSVPYGLFVNDGGELFIANSEASNVLVYQRGSRTPFETLSDPKEYPYGVTEDSHQTVFVVNALTVDARPGNVAVYPSGSLKPASTFKDRKWYSPVAIASDASDNIYVCFDTKSSWGVDEFLAGTTTPVNLNLQITSCWGIVVDKRGNVVVADLQGQRVEIFAPGSTTPSHTIPVSGDPFALTLSSDAKSLYVSDYSDNYVHAYSYPEGKLLATIPQSGYNEASGIAVDPPAPK